jgi:hypothetical protein
MSEETPEPKEESAPLRPMTEQDGPTSAVFHVSIRAWIALLLTGTVCAMQFSGKVVEEPLYTLATVALGYYFGQKGQGK